LKIIHSILAGGVLLFSSTVSFAATPETQTTHRELKLENECVKVWKTTITPGKPLQKVNHPHPLVVIPLHGGDVMRKEQEGTQFVETFKEGDAYWIHKDKKNEFHSISDSSKDFLEVMVVEIKGACPVS